MGKTLLPLPPNHGAALMDAAGRDKDRIHVLESAVVMWTRQIKNILKMDPETALKSGNPGTTPRSAIHSQHAMPGTQEVCF